MTDLGQANDHNTTEKEQIMSWSTWVQALKGDIHESLEKLEHPQSNPEPQALNQFEAAKKAAQDIIRAGALADHEAVLVSLAGHHNPVYTPDPWYRGAGGLVSVSVSSMDPALIPHEAKTAETE